MPSTRNLLLIGLTLVQLGAFRWAKGRSGAAA